MPVLRRLLAVVITWEIGISVYVEATDCYEGLMKCVVPEFADYATLGPEKAFDKFLEDPLRVPCNKIEKATSCLKTEYPLCQYLDILRGHHVLNETLQTIDVSNRAIDVVIAYICRDEYTDFNNAKNCTATRLEEVYVKMNEKQCKPPPDDINVCSESDSAALTCAINSYADVCGRPVADKTKSLFLTLCNILQNLALWKATAQSSTWDGNSDSSKAVDGNSNPDYYAGKSCTHTLNDRFVWWAVDLGCDARIDKVTITNRADNSLARRLHDFNVGVSDNDPRVVAPRPSNYQLCGARKGPAKVEELLAFTCQGDSTVGRYVIVQMPLDEKNYLHICEVVVNGECIKTGNIALGKTTLQSSTDSELGASSHAVDGKFNTDYFAGSCIHTKIESNVWWMVDLGCTARVAKISITNRGDRGYGYRLHDFTVGIGQRHPNAVLPRPNSYHVCSSHKGSVDDGLTMSFACRNKKAVGRYVFVQIPGETKNCLNFCEVVVNGACI